MTIKLTTTCIDKIKNQQRRYAKYLQMDDVFGIVLKEFGDSAGDDKFACLIKNADEEIWVQDQSEDGIYLNGEEVKGKAKIFNGDVLNVHESIILSFRLYELTGKDLFRSSRSSKEPIVLTIPAKKKVVEQKKIDYSNPVGHEINGYFFEDILNYGNMGIVYKGIQRSLKRPVAIKTVAPKNLNNTTLIKRFMNMANLAWRLNHPYIVQIYDTGISKEFKMHYVVMERVEGETLAEILKQDKKLEIDRACKMISQLASALSFAHRQFIIHRDVNPSNIIITKNEYIKLIGLALSKIVDPEEESIHLTRVGQAMGTMGYISPEQARSAADVDYRTDIYSLGVIFYECLCGTLPYDPEVLKVPAKYLKALKSRPKHPPHKVNPAIPEPLSAIVMKCLEPNPKYRYHKAEDVLQDIKGYSEAIQLSVAQKRIKAMFPGTPDIEGYEFDITFEPMEEIGGDFYDFVKIEDNKWGIVIGDVTGHGVEAAVVMGMVKSVLKVMAKSSSSATEVVEQTNENVSPDMDTTTFTTVAYGILDTKKHTFHFARAGHNPLILYNHERDPRLTTYSPKGSIVGVPWALNCEEVELVLKPGDILIQYTDGITEAQSKKGEEFGFDRLCETIEQLESRNLKKITDGIKSAVNEFSKGSDEADDITLLAFKVC